MSLSDDERLDSQDPLRHLRATDDELVPEQPKSVHDELVKLDVPLGGSRDHTVQLSLAVDAGPGCGGITWPAGEVLTRYLARRGPDALAGTRVLELGSGTGLVGLLAGALGARVYITDQAPLLATMEKNIALNSMIAPNVSAVELNWGEPLSAELSGPYDLILAADCVYFEPAFPLLVQTLCDLLPPTVKTETFFCYKKRRKADKRFFTLLKRYFTWEDVEDDPEHEIYSREAISLLRLHRKPLSTQL
ncbi:S-adenosyl-L-methionine-dependent methyltransferase [Peniophora sp. CONT]|nr:S-adenosyl-L-methionine-dependent methyltransferase [Peniophora sp. CONT]